jgi:trans-2,3-dihydro-3-hydroxyanthranilate isomerase
MDTRQVLLVDAFATEPLGGVPVVVLPDGQDCSTAQLRRIASEFEASSVVTPGEDGLRRTGTAQADGTVSAAVAGGAALVERDVLDDGTHPIETDWLDDPLEVTVESDLRAEVATPAQKAQSVSASTDEIAGALGMDPAVMDDVSADLPIAKCAFAGGTVLVPVNFLEHLSSAEPAPARLRELLAAEDATRLCAFTFDTIERDTDVHARVFDPAATDFERPASGLASAACGAHLARHPVFDEDRESVRIEWGRFVDRPGTVETTLEAEPSVSGTALTVLDSTIGVPPEDDDDIIEV